VSAIDTTDGTRLRRGEEEALRRGTLANNAGLGTIEVACRGVDEDL